MYVLLAGECEVLSSTLSKFMFFSFSSFFFVFFSFWLCASVLTLKNRVHKGKGNIKAKVSISDSICQQ